jgi:hypothetical protein
MQQEKERFFIVPTLSLHSDELFIYGRKEWVSEPDLQNRNSLANLDKNLTGHELSNKGKKRAKRAIKYLFYNATEKVAYNPRFHTQYRFRVNFITLTLASRQIHEDSEIKSKLLHQFLIEAKKRWGLVNYVWKAERQMNGNLHFHILSDKFIPWLELRNCWNRIQNKLGYIDRFNLNSRTRQPNSTDVHSLRKVSNVYSYVTKYMLKKFSGNRLKVKATAINHKWADRAELSSVSPGVLAFLSRESYGGRIWACSQSLSNITGARAEITPEIAAEIHRINMRPDTKRVDKDYISMLFFKAELINETESPILWNILNMYVKSIFTDPPEVNIYANSTPSLPWPDAM